MTSTVVTPRGPRRIAIDIPNPNPKFHYLWAADRSAHPQGYSRFKADGYWCVPSSEAEELGLDGYTDPNGQEVTKDSANVIRFGDLVLMKCTEENWARICGEKRGQFDAFEGSVEADAEEKFAGVHEEYKRRKSGG